MRCIACNKLLTDFESSRKSVTTGEYIDMCTDCYKHIRDDVNVIENNDLLHINDVLEEELLFNVDDDTVDSVNV